MVTMVFIYILLLHFLADFVLQPYWMSVEKANNMTPLILHIIIYTAVIFFGLWAIVDFQESLLFSLFTGALHFVVDFGTSRIITDNSDTLKLDPDESKPVHRRLQLWGPITLLGFDQLLHQTCLAYAVHLFFP
jgi:hypothetical protein